LPVTSSRADRFAKFFTGRLKSKFAIKSLLNGSTNLKRVATLPCEMPVFKELSCLGTGWGKPPCKTQPLKTVCWTNFRTVMLSLFNSLTKKICRVVILKVPQYERTAATQKKMSHQNASAYDKWPAIYMYSHCWCLSVSSDRYFSILKSKSMALLTWQQITTVFVLHVKSMTNSLSLCS